MIVNIVWITQDTNFSKAWDVLFLYNHNSCNPGPSQYYFFSYISILFCSNWNFELLKYQQLGKANLKWYLIKGGIDILIKYPKVSKHQKGGLLFAPDLNLDPY